MKKFYLLFFLILSVIIITKTYAQNENAPYKNAKLSIKQRVDDLLKRMTLQEKLDLLGGTGFATKPIKRLGIPELKMSDGPLGVRWGKSTAFPAGICMAASWDTSLINKVGESIGEELRGKGRDVLLGPNVNIARLPLCGRDFESFGEDPYLTSRMAVSYIEGVQSVGVAATVKHFAANNQEYERMFVNEKIDERTLNEIYFPAFKAAVTDAHVLCIMAAYNKINGTYCSENPYLLNDVLRDKWGFNGLAMSDWGAVHGTLGTARNGLDLEMPTGIYMNPETLTGAVDSGKVKIKTINNKVRNILTLIFKLGLFDHPIKPNPALINSKKHQSVAYRSAVEGIVLLKNQSEALPLNVKNIKSIAVIGPDAAIARTQGGGSAMVTPVYSVSPLQALEKKLPKKIKINFSQGVKFGGDLIPIPAKSLFQIASDKSANGLKAEYFKNENLEGNPAVTKIDSQINFNWDNLSPVKGFDPDSFSVRWTGFLKASETTDFSIDVVSDDGVRMYFDDSLVINDWNQHAPETRTFKTHLRKGIFYKIKLEYFQNTGGAEIKLGWRNSNKNLIQEAVEAAKNSDVALVFAGTSNNFEGEGSDRPNLDLPDDQDQLINEIAAANKNTIVIITSGSPVLMSKWLGNVNAVVESWFGGDEIGNAIADVLLGKYNPSGKLPITFPKSWKDCSAYNSYHKKDSVSVYSDSIFVGYRYFDKNDIKPLFPFGYGLSYTKFDFSNINIKGEDNNLVVSFDVKNVGKYKGAEIPQLYIHAINSVVEEPPKVLKNFSRVVLNRGETETVKFKLVKEDFEYYNTQKHDWQVSPGSYEILIGSSSRDIKLKEKITFK